MGKELRHSYLIDLDTKELLLNLQQGGTIPKRFFLQQDLILRKGRIWIVKQSPYWLQLLAYIHSNLVAGHSGYHKTVQKAKADFYWKGMLKDVKKYVNECALSREQA